MKPLAIDLYAGIGGWAAGLLACGYRVVGFDIQRFPQGYPGELVLQDVRTLDGRRFRGAAVIVASPPCEKFALYGMPFVHKDARPVANLDLVNEVWRIREESGVPTILENVRALQYFLGPAECRMGSFYLWGDVPLLRPTIYRFDPAFSKLTRCGAFYQRTREAPRGVRYKFTSHRGPHLRAKIPFDLARWIGESFYPVGQTVLHSRP